MSAPKYSCIVRPQPGFVQPGTPADEEARLAALRALRLLDTKSEERFDRIVRMTQKAFDVPIAYVALVDAERQWFKSRIGLEPEQTPRNTSFCGHAILQDDALIIPDARRDARFAGNPMVVGEPFARFYAGLPLRVKNGYKVGTLCVIDKRPRQFGSAEIETLQHLGAFVEREFELADALALKAQAEESRLAREASEKKLTETVSQLQAAKARTEELLRSILPARVIAELESTGKVTPTFHPEVAVLFADFSGFTKVAAMLTPEEMVAELNECFCHFDWVIGKNGCEKLKTIGDGYLAVAGLSNPSPDSAMRLLRAALEIRDFVAINYAERTAAGYPAWQVRIGLHVGPLVCGMVGVQRPAYDVWGDTVNTASRVETAGEVGRVNVSRAFLDRVGHAVKAEARGEIACKHKGLLEMFFIHHLDESSAATPPATAAAGETGAASAA
jgi:class 3 adenylate cyclase